MDGEQTAQLRFGVWDYSVFGAMLVISTAIGLYHIIRSRNQTNPQEFLMQGRHIGIFPMAMSSVATYMSAVTLMGNPAEAYASGVQCLWTLAGNIWAHFAIAYIYMPCFHGLHISSATEYLGVRFNLPIRLIGATFSATALLLYTSCVVYVPALALNQVTGFSLWGSILAIGVVCIFYTSLGGFTAVIWTDVFQLLVMFISIFLLLIKGIIDNGGLNLIWKKATEGHRTEIFYWTPVEESRYTFYSLTIGHAFQTIYAVGIHQAVVQRQLASPSVTAARWCLLGNYIGSVAISAPCYFMGIIMYAKYAGCDPLGAGLVSSWDQLPALFAMETLNFIPGLVGIYVGGTICATLSTMSSTINSIAVIILEDFIKPFKTLTDRTTLNVSKILAVIIGATCLALVAIAQQMGTVIQALYIVMSVTGGTLTGLFTLGMLFPWANAKGAITGMITGAGFVLWILIGSKTAGYEQPHAPVSIDACSSFPNITSNMSSTISNMTTPEAVLKIYTISPAWYMCLTVITVVTIGVIASILTGPTSPDTLAPGVICPAIENLCKSLPGKMKKPLGFANAKNEQSKTDGGNLKVHETNSTANIVEMEVIPTPTKINQ